MNKLFLLFKKAPVIQKQVWPENMDTFRIFVKEPIVAFGDALQDIVLPVGRYTFSRMAQTEFFRLSFHEAKISEEILRRALSKGKILIIRATVPVKYVSEGTRMEGDYRNQVVEKSQKYLDLVFITDQQFDELMSYYGEDFSDKSDRVDFEINDDDLVV